MLTVKKGNDGKPISKARKTTEDREKILYGASSSAARFSLADPDVEMDPAPQQSAATCKKTKSSSKKKSTKKKGVRRGTRSEINSAFIDKSRDYNQVSALASASAGLPFSQLLRGDAEQEKKELDKMFSKVGLRDCLIGEGSSNGAGTREPGFLVVAKLKLY